MDADQAALRLDIGELTPIIEDTQTKLEEDLTLSLSTTRIITDLLLSYKKEDQTYDYDQVNKEDMKQIGEHFSRLNWIDQIKLRLLHIDFVHLAFPQIHDPKGFKYTKKKS